MDRISTHSRNSGTLKSTRAASGNSLSRKEPAAPAEEFSRSGNAEISGGGAEKIFSSVSGKKAGEVLFGKRPDLLASETIKEYALWGEQRQLTVSIFAAVEPKGPSDHNYWHIRAYDTDGSVKWTYDRDYATTPPVPDGNGNSCLRTRDRVVVLDRDGREIQSIPAHGSSWHDSPPAFGPNGEIYFITDNPDRSGTGDANLRLCAYKDGKELWHYNGVGSYGGDHRVMAGKDGTVYLTASHHSKEKSFGGFLGVKFVETPAVIALNPKDGSEKFIHKISQWDMYTKGNIAEGPDGTVYAYHGAHSLVALAPRGLKKWEYRQKDAQSFDNGAHSRLFSPPVFDREGNIYIGTTTTANYPEGYLISIDKYGKERWNRPIDGGLASPPQISPDGKLYCGSSKGKLLVFDAASGNQKEQYTVGDLGSDGFAFGENGELYITTRSAMAALQLDREKLNEARFSSAMPADDSAAEDAQGPSIDVQDSYVIIDDVTLPKKMNRLGIWPRSAARQ
jgi:outer membrane protein assembly factor BamB